MKLSLSQQEAGWLKYSLHFHKGLQRGNKSMSDRTKTPEMLHKQRGETITSLLPAASYFFLSELFLNCSKCIYQHHYFLTFVWIYLIHFEIKCDPDIELVAEALFCLIVALIGQ